MDAIIGGREVRKSYNSNTDIHHVLQDKTIYNNNGCIVKVKLWDEGVKYVATYAGDCQNGYDGSIPKDGNKATREYFSI